MRLGVVGLGIIWRTVHFPILNELNKHFTITALCASSEDSLLPWREKYSSARAYTDYRDLVHDADVDAVLVATPINLNAQVASAALSAGKHVFLEKPIATSYQMAAELRAVEERTGKSIFLLEQAIYHPQIPVIKNIIDTGKIGKLVSYERVSHSSIDNAGPYADSAWRLKGDFPLGLILDSGFHDMALLMSIFGQPRSIYSLGAQLRPGMGEYDYVLSVLAYENGVSGTFSHSGYICNKNYFIVRGTEGAIYDEGDKLVIESKTGDCEEICTPMPDLYKQMWLHLAEISASGETPLFTAKDATELMKVFDAMGRSIKNEIVERI